MPDEHAQYENAVALSSPWTWRDPVREKLFPTRYAPCPELPVRSFEVGEGDVVTTRVYVSPSVLDRLRVLVTGKMIVEVRVACEHPVGQTTSTSAAWPVMRFR